MCAFISFILLQLLIGRLAGVDSSIMSHIGVQQSILTDIYISDTPHIVGTTVVPSVIVCMLYCSRDLHCMSFSYNTESMACVFYDVVYGSKELGVNTTATRHYNVGESGCCPVQKGYFHSRDIEGCYKPYVHETVDFSTAETTCIEDGGHLVKINDVTERNALDTVLVASTAYKTAYWTGLYQDGPLNTWVWRDGTGVILSDLFRPKEPSGSGRCAYFPVGSDGMNDCPCSTVAFRVLCEIDIL